MGLSIMVYHTAPIISGIYIQYCSITGQERNLLTTGQWQCGEVDFEKKTAEVICTIVPKEYTPGSTQVSILCNEREWEMAYQDSEYTAKIEVPLFERSEVSARRSVTSCFRCCICIRFFFVDFYCVFGKMRFSSCLQHVYQVK